MIRQLVQFCVLSIGLALSQGSAAQMLERGKLIASTDSLSGTMFEETVMLLVHHDEDGSIGIMINRPTSLHPTDVYPDIAGAESYTGVLYFGGPLTSARPFLLARRTDEIQESAIRIVNGVYLSGDPSLLSAFDAPQRNEAFSRVYAGSAQWSPGQLQAEVESGAWNIIDASADLIFSDDAQDLWMYVIGLPQGSAIAAAHTQGILNQRTRTAR